jgi:phospholipase C
VNPAARLQFEMIALLALATSLIACNGDDSTSSDSLAPRSTETADAPAGQRSDVPGLDRLKHVVVIYLENHSFDNLYGEFPGADGLPTAAATTTQVDANGNPFEFLPFPTTVPFSPFPTNLPNAPFSIEQYVPVDANTPDLVHRFYQEQSQIDGGKMDRFAVVSDAKGLVMGYYHTAHLPLADEARQYALCDNFFHAAFGGSFLNHFWFIAARTPVFPSAPAAIVAQLDGQGQLVPDGAVTPDGYAVNTLFTVNRPHPSNVPADRLVPNQTFPTIGDRLSAKKIGWA